MTRIAVTGASGFVARELIPQLLEGGHEVRGIARRAPEGVAVGTARGFSFVPGDVRDDAAVGTTLQGCDVVIHLAASSSPDDNVGQITVDGTRRVLAAAKSHGISRIVYLSCLGAEASSHSGFLAAKWEAESIIRGADVPFTILRPSVVLGHDDGIVRPIAQIMRTWPVVPIPGTGLGRQQPIDVLDLCRCVREAMTSDDVANETVSVGGPMFITFRQLVDIIAGELGLMKRRALIPDRFIPLLASRLPVGARGIYLEPGISRFRHGIVASPGIVERVFGFQPRSVVTCLGSYLA